MYSGDEASDKNPNQDKNTNIDFDNAGESDALAEYTSEEIEHARVWLELIGNIEIDTLTVSEGEQVNQYDDDSVKYQEDVVYLGADITADGGIVYSGNGDGTINLYDVPSHWPSLLQVDNQSNETMEEYTQDIIDNPEKIDIGPGDDEEVEEIIKKLNIEF